MDVAKMLAAVRAYQRKLGYDFKYESVEARQEHINQLTLALNQEVAEFIDWTPWKPWRPIPSQGFDRTEAAYELIDIFFFTVNLWAAIGMEPEEFGEYFKVKLAENHSRIARGYNSKPIKPAKGETP